MLRKVQGCLISGQGYLPSCHPLLVVLMKEKWLLKQLRTFTHWWRSPSFKPLGKVYLRRPSSNALKMRFWSWRYVNHKRRDWHLISTVIRANFLWNHTWWIYQLWWGGNYIRASCWSNTPTWTTRMLRKKQCRVLAIRRYCLNQLLGRRNCWWWTR